MGQGTSELEEMVREEPISVKGELSQEERGQEEMPIQDLHTIQYTTHNTKLRMCVPIHAHTQAHRTEYAPYPMPPGGCPLMGWIVLVGGATHSCLLALPDTPAQGRGGAGEGRGRGGGEERYRKEGREREGRGETR